MNILWITNILFPDAANHLGMKQSVFGGWMLASANAILKSGGVNLAVASTYNGNNLIKITKTSITYYLIPSSKKNSFYNKTLEKYWEKINYDFNPDIVHIHGTEYAHGLSFMKSCGNDNVVISIQGLVSVCARYYYAGIPMKDIIRYYTLKDILKGGIIFGKNDFERRGKLEHEYLKLGKHVIGRTSWDKSHVLSVNPNLNYYVCNETLRDIFYNNQWNYDKCEKYSIFISQASYPIKGLHMVLKAMPLILKKYPNTKLYIAGEDISSSKSFSQKLKVTGYSKYIKSIIKKNKLESKVIFTGILNEDQMCKYYLKANVFVCPSSIENSPNSLGEAQILGVPYLASFVGGVPDLIPIDCYHRLYRFEEVEMLAHKVCNIFSQSFFDNSLIIKEAKKRHSKENNCAELLSIYRNISQ